MKKILLTIELEFANKISVDEELQEVAENIASAVKHAADTCGIAPEMSDTYLTKVTVFSEALGVEAERTIG
jgi:hypothetical protein